MPDFVGYRRIEVADGALMLTFPTDVLYPTEQPEHPEIVGGYALDVALDAPVKAGVFPLALISHGSGSSPWVYRALAHYLARHGFIVGLPTHPGNNRDDNSREGTSWNLMARPRHLHLAIDSLVHHPPLAASIKGEAVGLIGHSMGGYTALALAGGRPSSVPHDSPHGLMQPIPVEADSRVQALVLLAPATPWFLPAGSLQAVKVPILLLEAEKDAHTTREHGQIVLNGVADRSEVTHRIVENAGHFSFLSPFPVARVSPAFPPSQDPPGFNRAHFQAQLGAEVAAFLRRKL